MGRTWADVEAFATEAFDELEVRADQVSGLLGEQPLRLELAQAWNEPWLHILSPVAHESQVTRPFDAMRWSASLSVGGLAILDEMLVVRAALCLAELDRAALDRYVRFVAREAKRLADLHTGWRGASHAVDYLAD